MSAAPTKSRHRVEGEAAQRALSRLSSVKAWLRAEIGHAEISSAELVGLSEKDVVLLDELTARPDKGEGGTVRLTVGQGYAGVLEAELLLENGRYKAKIGGFASGRPRLIETERGKSRGDSACTEPTNPSIIRYKGRRSMTDSSQKSAEGADLLTDIPLQIVVELARVPVTAEDVVALRVGQVIDLNRMPGEPVEMSVNGKVVGRGELVEVEGHLGVRILSLAG